MPFVNLRSREAVAFNFQFYKSSSLGMLCTFPGIKVSTAEKLFAFQQVEPNEEGKGGHTEWEVRGCTNGTQSHTMPIIGLAEMDVIGPILLFLRTPTSKGGT